MECENQGKASNHNTVNINRSDNIHSQAALLDTWDQEYSQLTCGAFDGSVKSIDNPNIRLFIEDMNRAVFQKGGVRDDRIGFGIPVGLKGNCNLCGEVVQDKNLLVFSGDPDFEFLSPENFRFYGIEIIPSNLNDQKLCRMIQKLRDKLAFRNRVMLLNDERALQLIYFFSSIFEVLEGNTNLQNSPKRIETLNRQIIGTTLDCLDGVGDSGDGLGPTMGNHWIIVKNIRDLVIQNPDCPLSVAELAMELRISRRTLQNACRNVLGMSPVVFLRALRLSEVRREIPFSRSVTDAATQWGFWHFGYFARDYKYMFGELPSMTHMSGKRGRIAHRLNNLDT